MRKIHTALICLMASCLLPLLFGFTSIGKSAVLNSKQFFDDKFVTNISVDGMVKNENNVALEGAMIKVVSVETKEVLETTYAKKRGRFSVNVPHNDVVWIYFSKSGYVTKILEFNTIPPEGVEIDNAVGFTLDMSLFEIVPEVDFSILEKPMGKVIYDSETKQLSFDLNHTKKVQKEIQKLKAEYDKNKGKKD